MADVHLGRTRCCERRRVAVKTLPRKHTERIPAFIHEASLSLMMSHENIVAAYEAGRDPNGYYLVLDAIDGADLRRIQLVAEERGSRMPPHLAAYVINKAARGLHAAHELIRPGTSTRLNVVHCDVSPQNILLSKYGEVKVCDFGVAQSRLRGRQGICGKPRYLSPEQCMNRPLDRRTDVFSLGLILYELLSATTVFPGVDRHSITETSRFRFDDLPGIDPLLMSITQTALQVDRDRRYQTARAFQLALSAWLKRNHPRSRLRKQLATWLARRIDRAPTMTRLERWDARAKTQLC